MRIASIAVDAGMYGIAVGIVDAARDLMSIEIAKTLPADKFIGWLAIEARQAGCIVHDAQEQPAELVEMIGCALIERVTYDEVKEAISHHLETNETPFELVHRLWPRLRLDRSPSNEPAVRAVCNLFTAYGRDALWKKIAARSN